MLCLTCIIVTTAMVFLILKIRKIQNYFQNNNIPCVPPIFLIGSTPSSTLMRASISESYHSIYESLSPHKIGGFYDTIQPVFMVRDPEYVQQVLINNYSNFHDRGFQVDEKLNPLDGHLFFFNGAKWKFLRGKLTSVFTFRKIQLLYNEMLKCTDHVVDHLDAMDFNGKDVDLNDLLLRYTVNVVASTAFGMELHHFEDKQSKKMFEIAKELFSPSVKNSLFIILRFINPKMLSMFRIKTVAKDIDDYFTKIVSDAFKHRLSTGLVRNDVIQSLMQLREKGQTLLKDHDEDENVTELELNDTLLAAQAFLFFIAGSETTQNTLYSLLYLFSIHDEIQETAREEVMASIRTHGSLKFESVQSMSYLNMCVKETLRIFPPSPVHLRVCTKDFTFPDGTTIKKGDRVIIPAFSIQRDPEHYEDPLKFKPERFSQSPLPGTYLPFSDGPKICIGKQFAETEIKLLTARLLEKFRFKPASQCETDLSKIRFEPKDFFLSPAGGFSMKIEKI